MYRVCAEVQFCIYALVPGLPKPVLAVVLNRLAVLETQQQVHFALLNEILNTVKCSTVVDHSTELPEELSLPVDSVDTSLTWKPKSRIVKLERSWYVMKLTVQLYISAQHLIDGLFDSNSCMIVASVY